MLFGDVRFGGMGCHSCDRGTEIKGLLEVILRAESGQQHDCHFRLLNRRHDGGEQLLVGGGGPADMNGTPSHTITVTNFDDVDAGGIEGGRNLGNDLGGKLLTEAVVSIAKCHIHKGELRHWLPSFCSRSPHSARRR